MSTLPTGQEGSQGSGNITMEDVANHFPLAHIHLSTSCIYAQSRASDGKRFLFVLESREEGTVSAYLFDDTFVGLDDNKPCGLNMIRQLAQQGKMPSNEKVHAVGKAVLEAEARKDQMLAIKSRVADRIASFDFQLKQSLHTFLTTTGLMQLMYAMSVGNSLTDHGVRLMFKIKYQGFQIGTEKASQATEAILTPVTEMLNQLTEIIMPGAPRVITYKTTSLKPLIAEFEAVIQGDSPMQQLLKTMAHLAELAPETLRSRRRSNLDELIEKIADMIIGELGNMIGRLHDED